MQNNESYQEYLMSNHWQGVRIECLMYYGLRCYCCNVPEKMSVLDVHHMHYNTLGNENYKKDVIPLCKRCHEQIHLGKTYDRTAIEILRDRTEKYSEYLHSENYEIEEEDDIDIDEQYINDFKHINVSSKITTGFTSISDILKSKYK